MYCLLPFHSMTVKGAVRAFPAKTSWGTTWPLICQAVNKLIPALLPWAAWPIRGLVVPYEVLAGNALTAPFLIENSDE